MKPTFRLVHTTLVPWRKLLILYLIAGKKFVQFGDYWRLGEMDSDYLGLAYKNDALEAHRPVLK